MDYTLIRSARRTISMEIKNGEVLVRAPLRMSGRDIERFVSEHADWISSHTERQKRRLQNHPEPDEARKKELIAMARSYLPGAVARYADIMGLYPAGITITSARTRFGSCSSKGRISFSWRLMQYPTEAVDYVVVHELAHLRHMDHGKEFYALIEKHMPDYKARRKLLKE